MSETEQLAILPLRILFAWCVLLSALLCPQQLLRQSKQEPDFLVRCFALGKPRALVGSHVGK